MRRPTTTPGGDQSLLTAVREQAIVYVRIMASDHVLGQEPGRLWYRAHVELKGPDGQYRTYIREGLDLNEAIDKALQGAGMQYDGWQVREDVPEPARIVRKLRRAQ